MAEESKPLCKVCQKRPVSARGLCKYCYKLWHEGSLDSLPAFERIQTPRKEITEKVIRAFLQAVANKLLADSATKDEVNKRGEIYDSQRKAMLQQLFKEGRDNRMIKEIKREVLKGIR